LQAVSKGNVVVDATCGRGRDTLVLSQLVGKNGEVHAFDVQIEAISATRRLLEQELCTVSTQLVAW
jgi:ubiquinone/menaquinone biosynthesis C-methylase UbiE